MIIQNFAQLDDVYGKEEAETIRGNCGNIIYLITTELKALEEISKMCGEVKSKKDDKTASTPLVTVSDLQRMKQYEVIILRLRKQPFKTKITPYWKLDWGTKYPLAKYPLRKKREVHTFDIKEYVKNQKKKKLLEMMNAADDSDRGVEGGMRPSGFPFELPPMRERETTQTVPDFLTRNPGVISREEKPSIPDFETFKRQMDEVETSPRSVMTTPKQVEEDDDDLGFDVDELVRKIDAKIAELEAEEKREAEEEEKKRQSQIQEEPPVNTEPTTAPIKLDEADDDDDFFDDFFDN
jgi:hypothetical protein